MLIDILGGGGLGGPYPGSIGIGFLSIFGGGGGPLVFPGTGGAP
jgi:hypothetical protein